MSDRPRTPPLLYFLAALVVIGIFLVWRESRVAGERLQTRWATEPLAAEAIARNLESDDFDRTGHALVQLAARLRGAQGGLPPDFLEPLWPTLEGIAARPEAALRERLTPVLAYAADPRATSLLQGLLRDRDDRVALNAAIGLAARGVTDGAALIRAAIEGTRGEQAEQRRSLLMSFRHVAAEGDRGFLENELERARLDRDREAEAYCLEALERLRRRDASPRQPR